MGTAIRTAAQTKDSGLYPSVGYLGKKAEEAIGSAGKTKKTLIVSPVRFKYEASKLLNTPVQSASSFLVLYSPLQSTDSVVLAGGPFEALTFAWCKFVAVTGRFPEKIIFLADENSAEEHYLLTSLYPSAMKMEAIPIEYRKETISSSEEESDVGSFDNSPRLDPFDCNSLSSSESLLRRETVAEQCPSMAPYLLACTMSKSSRNATKYSPPWQAKGKESK
jgi:hypothetical protein